MHSIEINETFDLACRFVNETQANIFVTGNAGTGKTSFLHYITRNSPKNIVVAAPTGVAAINAGGVTLHSLFQLPLGPFIPTLENAIELASNIRHNKRKLSLLRLMDVLIIDEISMVRCDVLDAIDTVLKSVRKTPLKPFGGAQVIFIGDLRQLSPVAKLMEWDLLSDYYTSPYFFDAKVFDSAKPLLIEFTKVYRQKDDRFVALLNKVRNLDLSDLEIQILNSRYQPQFIPPPDESYIVLTSHNNQADKINKERLEALQSQEFQYVATIENDFPEQIFPNDSKMTLKVGAQVMFNKNDTTYHQYFNGKIGLVKRLAMSSIFVESDGIEIEVRRETWENTRYVHQKSTGIIAQQVIGTYTQYPLKLAWAITIHKSQGLTFDKVLIDAGSSFSSGQVYVALSRCRSLEGIVLLSKINRQVIQSDERIGSGLNELKSEAGLDKVFQTAKKQFTLSALFDLFTCEKMKMAATLLQAQLRKEIQYFSQESLDWAESWRNSLVKLDAISNKFSPQIEGMAQRTADIETNEELLSRIKDAGEYFLKELQLLLDSLLANPVSTENKEASTKISESLNEAHKLLTRQIFLLKRNTKKFQLNEYLKSKLLYQEPQKKLSAYSINKENDTNDGAHNLLLKRLKEWRDQVCQSQNKPIYLVANKQTLKTISDFLPLEIDDLFKIPGLGPAKIKMYGEDILDIIDTYCDEFGITRERQLDRDGPDDFEKIKKIKKSMATKPPRETKVPTIDITLQLKESGMNLSEIAAERKLAESTIEGHIVQLIGKGKLQISELVDTEQYALIENTINSAGVEATLNQLKSMLPPTISFSQIKVVMNQLRPDTSPG